MSGFNSVYNNVSFALQLHSQAMFGLQEQASSGSRINRSSDDPSAAYQVLGLDSQKRYLSNYIQNIENVISAQDMATTVIQNMTETLTDTMTHITQIISGTYGEGENGQEGRERVAMEINDVLEQMVSSANTKYIDQYIFGGSNTSSKPYVVEKQDGEIVGISYQGGLENRNLEVAPGVSSFISYVGENIFGLNEPQTPVFYGDTGAEPGTGTSNIKGEVWLTVTHDGTNYRLSIDGGATETVVPAAGDVSNMAVTNADGDVLYVDAANITSAGVAKVKVPGTYDVFNVLINLRDLLRNDHGLSHEALADLVDEAAEALEDTKNVLLEKEASIGTKINFLDTLKDSIENIKFNQEDEATMLQEADIAQIAIDISRRQTLYEMSLSVAGKLMSLTLLDFIR